MKQTSKLIVTSVVLLSLFFTSCSSNQKTEITTTDSVAANIKMYMHTWDEIINHENPDRVGLDSARALCKLSYKLFKHCVYYY